MDFGTDTNSVIVSRVSICKDFPELVSQCGTTHSLHCHGEQSTTISGHCTEFSILIRMDKKVNCTGSVLLGFFIPI